jgi:hypothetical protein
MSPRDKAATTVGAIMFLGLFSLFFGYVTWWPVWGTQILFGMMFIAPLVMLFLDDYIERKDAVYYQTHPLKPTKPYKETKWDGAIGGSLVLAAGTALIMVIFVIIPEMVKQVSQSGGLTTTQITSVTNITSGVSWAIVQGGTLVIGAGMILCGLIITVDGLYYGFHQWKLGRSKQDFSR